MKVRISLSEDDAVTVEVNELPRIGDRITVGHFEGVFVRDVHWTFETSGHLAFIIVTTSHADPLAGRGVLGSVG